jgi:hypothetical protein
MVPLPFTALAAVAIGDLFDFTVNFAFHAAAKKP